MHVPSRGAAQPAGKRVTVYPYIARAYRSTEPPGRNGIYRSPAERQHLLNHILLEKRSGCGLCRDGHIQMCRHGEFLQPETTARQLEGPGLAERGRGLEQGHPGLDTDCGIHSGRLLLFGAEPELGQHTSLAQFHRTDAAKPGVLPRQYAEQLLHLSAEAHDIHFAQGLTEPGGGSRNIGHGRQLDHEKRRAAQECRSKGAYVGSTVLHAEDLASSRSPSRRVGIYQVAVQKRGSGADFRAERLDVPEAEQSEITPRGLNEPFVPLEIPDLFREPCKRRTVGAQPARNVADSAKAPSRQLPCESGLEGSRGGRRALLQRERGRHLNSESRPLRELAFQFHLLRAVDALEDLCKALFHFHAGKCSNYMYFLLTLRVASTITEKLNTDERI